MTSPIYVAIDTPDIEQAMICLPEVAPLAMSAADASADTSAGSEPNS